MEAHRLAMVAHQDELRERFRNTHEPADNVELTNPNPGPKPEMPAFDTRYTVDAPAVPPATAGELVGGVATTAWLRYQWQSGIVTHVLRFGHPETTLLSNNDRGHISEQELPLLASWLVRELAQKPANQTA